MTQERTPEPTPEPVRPEDDTREVGGDPACWAHLFDDDDAAADVDDSEGPSTKP